MKDRIVWLWTLLYAAIFTALGAIRYAGHHNLVDFGIFLQTASSAFGCFCNSIEGSHWAYHFSPILYAAGMALWVVRSPIALVALQAIACALVAPPIAALVRARADVRTARLAALAVLLYPPLAGLAFVDFHENVFAPAAIAWMLWAFDGGRWRLVLLFAAVALCVKEDQAAFLVIAGALGAWHYRGTTMGRAALTVAVAGGLVLVAFYSDIQPAVAHTARWAPQRFYAWTAADVRALVPAGIFGRVGFALLAFVPLLLLPFRSPMMWLAAAPLAEVLLSRMPTTFTMGTHYAGAWIGYVLAAFAFSIRRIGEPRAHRFLLGCIVLCILEFVVADPLHPGINLRPPGARDAALDRFLATIPSNAQIATQEEAYTHLALRDPDATLLPQQAWQPLRACFALTDSAYPNSPRLQEYGAQLARLVSMGRYVVVRRAGAITLYRVREGGEASSRCAAASRLRS